MTHFLLCFKACEASDATPAAVCETTCTSPMPPSARSAWQKRSPSGDYAPDAPRAADEAGGRRMRECKDCGRDLPPGDFSGGSNWRQCRRCKSQQVQLRKYEREGRQQTVDEWRSQDRFQWFVDFLAWKRRWERRHDVESSFKPQRRRCTAPRYYAAVALAAVFSAHQDEITVWTKHMAAQRKRETDSAWRRANVERRRETDRRKRERNPGLYKGFAARNAANQRLKRAEAAADSPNVPLNLIWATTDGHCGICGEPCDENWWHVDHVRPLGLGGKHHLDNLRPAHPYCNLVKGAKTNDTLDLAFIRETRVAWEASPAGQGSRSGARATCGRPGRYRAGCRCEKCRKAHNEMVRINRARTRARGPYNLRIRSGGSLGPSILRFWELRAEGWNKMTSARMSGLPARRIPNWERFRP